jgi:non-ribosomal peptide synthetase component F
MTTIIELIDTALRKFPHNTITANGETITYVELGKRIEHRVKRLAELGVKANMPVGVAAVTSVDMIINALAVIKAKAILAPLGFVKRTNPAQRLKNIITDSQLKIMIGAEALPAHFPKDVGVQHIKDSDLTKPTSAEHKQYADEKAPITPDSIYAYYFSSGSEGPPKGVKCTHSGIPKWQDTWTKTLGMQPGDNIAIHPRLTFDAGIWDLFRGLATGANIFWLPDDPTAEEIVDFINKNNITHITLHPSIIPLIDPASIKHPVKFVSTGDKFSAQIIQKFLESGHKLFNG